MGVLTQPSLGYLLIKYFFLLLNVSIKIKAKKRQTKFQALRKFHYLYKSTYTEKLLEKLLNESEILKDKFQREWVFNKFRFDFFLYEPRLAIEVDGGYHESPEQQKKDLEKYKEAKKQNIFLLRYTNSQIQKEREKVLNEIINTYIKLNKSNA